MGFSGRNSMNEKCGSKQTNFGRTWICNEKFTILKLRKQIVIAFQSESKKTKIKKFLEQRPKNANEVTF